MAPGWLLVEGVGPVVLPMWAQSGDVDEQGSENEEKSARHYRQAAMRAMRRKPSDGSSIVSQATCDQRQCSGTHSSSAGSMLQRHDSAIMLLMVAFV